MKGIFNTTIEELFELLKYENYICSENEVCFDINKIVKCKIRLNSMCVDIDKEYVLVPNIQRLEIGSTFPLLTGEFLISKSTFIKLILILMVMDKLGMHNNITNNSFINEALLTYLKNGK